MPTYSASKIRRAFEILQRSGRLDEVEKTLEKGKFAVELSEDDAKALANELNKALEKLKEEHPEYYEEVTDKNVGNLKFGKGSSDCPC